MPICIECSYPVSHLYSTYSRADDRSLGKGVRLTQCPRCQRFADKYVEYDFVVLFIDLVLIKPQVYRHLLFNRLGRDDNQFDRSIIRLGVLLLLFDVYLTWARIEKSPSVANSFLFRTPIIVQYFFFLTLNALATLAHHLTVRLLASIFAPRPHPFPGRGSVSDQQQQPSSSSHPISPPPASPLLAPQPGASQVQQHASTSPQPKHPHNDSSLTSSSTSSLPLTGSGANRGATGSHTPPPPPPPPPPPLRRASTAPILNVQPLPPPSPASPTAISTALLVSSCAKLFPILLVIWGPDGSGGGSSSESYTQSRTAMQSGTVRPLLMARQHGIATPVATVIAGPGAGAGAIPTGFPTSPSSPLSASSSYPSSGSWSMSSSFEEWLAGLAPTNQHLAGLVELISSLLSLGAADTHLVLLSNIEALYILLGCGYLRAVALAVAGLMARWAVQRVVLGAVGVG